MRKGSGFWKSDWFAGLVIAVVLAVAAKFSPLIDNLENFTYDLGMKASSKAPGDKVAVIAIDDPSIANIGRWPWPRTYLADMITALQKGGAKVVGVPIFLSEPQIDPGLKYINDIDQYYAANIAASGPTTPAIAALGQQLSDAQQALNTDSKLASSMKAAGNVVLPMEFELGEMQGHPDKSLPMYVTRNQVTHISDPGGTANSNGDLPEETDRAVPPIAGLGESAAFIGHLALKADEDGSYRKELLLVNYGGAFYPSMALMMAARSLNLGADDISVDLGNKLHLGKLAITTDSKMRMQTFYYHDIGDKPAFSVDSFYDVATGKIPLEKYRDKIVIIGPTAYGVGTALPTPIAGDTEPAIVLAHTVASILNQNFFVTPGWGLWLSIVLFLLATLYLTLGLPRLKAGPAAGASAAIVVALLATQLVMMTTSGLWVPLVLPAILIIVGHVLLTTKRFLITEKAKDKSEALSADSNRMLGIALQQQGQLDMALEKFRKCPMDDSMMDVLYNLALDYERKRQFNKAVSVYQYMSDYNPEFRDLKQKVARAQKLEETVILGGGSMSSAAATLIMDPNSAEKPMLGRYQVEKELGKGAMGVVYLGRDPKINRVVAIKTMALKDEFEADELAEIKERFFREAETAGRLNHPNIVTIYDAGEEHDLAYIAMEFLKGHDLARYVKPDALLPVPKVVQIVFKAAVALNYAHQHNVVHRDIKPANIMYEPESGALKITDFGIARITDASKTKTGTVLGTPTYMSPEQVAGKKVDGRSDLYSLGVMFYQMLSGVAPFRAESMASLMYKIANDPAPPLLEARPELAQQMPCLAAIIDKALSKDPATRYQTGQEFALAIKACVDSVTKKKTA